MMIDLFIEYRPKSYSDLVIKYFRTYEEDLVKERKARRLKRRRFWSAGVNDMVAVDQHDKWKRFGLALHTGIDPFPGKVHWMKVWHTNNNPKIILSYYLEFIEKFGCEFDPVFIFRPTNSAFTQLRHAPYHTKRPWIGKLWNCKCQSVLRQWNDPLLKGTVQHRWMRHKKNVMPEIAWSQLRRRFTPGFEGILQEGVTNGWYDTNRPLDV